MASSRQVRHDIPRSSQHFHFSRAAAGMLLATVFLGVLLVYSTLQNINRAENLMEQFLLDKGQTIIRSIEAGSRATMMHHMGSGDPLHTLLNEYTRDQEIQFIIIINEDGSALENVGDSAKGSLSNKELLTIQNTGRPLTTFNQEKGIFTLSRLLKASNNDTRLHLEMSPHSRLFSILEGKKIISIGLQTEQFDIARKQDVRHAMFMGAILFLVSSAGLYFLFLYQKIRITSSNLSDMKLYTDNIIESIPVSLITLNAKDEIVSCNRNAEEIIGDSRSQLQGKSIHQALPDCSVTIAEACDSLFEHEIEFINPDEKLIPLRISCSPLVNNNGEIIGKVIILRDMSLLKDMELQLERSRRMAALGKIATAIAHEIRNPLGTLRGFVQYFGSGPETAETRHEYSKLMISEIDRLNKTVSGLLQFSRPRDLQLRKIDINELFDKTISLLQADINNKDIKLSKNVATNMSITADPDLLLQVLINLLKNSINASHQSGEIILTAYSEGTVHKISVIDAGKGISKDDREKMFDPFFTTNQSGTGLGLAISHQIIEQHSGTFEVTTQPDRGTNITICLPIQEKVTNA